MNDEDFLDFICFDESEYEPPTTFTEWWECVVYDDTYDEYNDDDDDDYIGTT